MTKGGPYLSTVAVLLSVGLSGESVVPQRHPRPEPCPSGRFLVTGAQLVVGGGASLTDAVRILGGQVMVDSGCALTTGKRGKVKIRRSGVTRVKARWRTCGELRKVRLKARIAPDCNTMTGTIRAKGRRPRRRPFQARRSVCGDGIVDREAGEACDPGGPGGDQACPGTCNPPGSPEECRCTSATVSCEVLNGAECLLPYPSSHFLVPDATTATGFRLNIPAEALPRPNGPPISPAPLKELDGFSPAVQILMHFPQGVDLEASNASRLLPAGCCGQPAGPPWVDTRTYTARSLGNDSPSVLLDADTGTRVLHWLELDAHAEGNPARQTLFMRPGEMLVPGHRYIVAMRNLTAADGGAVVAEAAFTALRDGTESGIQAIEDRRAQMERDVFPALAASGVTRGDLVLAFDFVVQSDSQLTRQMLSMRDQAFAWLDDVAATPDRITFTVDSVITHDCTHPEAVVWREVAGTFESPLFLDGVPVSTGVQFHTVDANDVPVPNGFMPAPYDISIPCSVHHPQTTSRPMVLGHGLFGTGTSMVRSVPSSWGQLASWTYIAGGTDWRGLSSDDRLWAASHIIGIGTNKLNNFPALPDRLRQGMLNTLVLGRMMKLGLFNRDSHFQVSPGEGVFPGQGEDMFYYGISLGGIMGTWFAALTPDIDRFVVDVPAINFSCLIQRSTQWRDFTLLMAQLGVTDPMDFALGVQLLHEGWVSAEPAGYARHVTRDPLPGSGNPKRILMAAAWLDKQVSNQCTEAAARTLGLPNLVDGSLVRGLQEIPDAAGPLDSAFVMYDSGAFDLFDPRHDPFIPPLANVIPSDVCDPHSARPSIPAGVEQSLNFLQPSGRVVNFCNGPCDAGDATEIAGSVCTF